MARKEVCCGLSALEVVLIVLFVGMTGVSVGLISVMATVWISETSNAWFLYTHVYTVDQLPVFELIRMFQQLPNVIQYIGKLNAFVHNYNLYVNYLMPRETKFCMYVMIYLAQPEPTFGPTQAPPENHFLVGVGRADCTGPVGDVPLVSCAVVNVYTTYKSFNGYELQIVRLDLQSNNHCERKKQTNI